MNLERAMALGAAQLMRAIPRFPGRWRVQRWAGARGELYRGFRPRKVVCDGFDFQVTAEASLDVFLNGITPASAVEMTIRHHVKPGQHTLDIGANLGWTARLMSALVGPSGSVTAFEPMPSALANLRLNADTAAYRNIKVVDIALSDAAGEVPIYLSSDQNTALASLREPDAASGAKAIRVRTAPLDTMLGELPRISFVKIDVEGAEQKVLSGMQGLLRRDRPVVALELSDAWLRRMGDSGDGVLRFMQQHGYGCFQYGQEPMVPMQHAPAEQVDIVCLPAGAGH